MLMSHEPTSLPVLSKAVTTATSHPPNGPSRYPSSNSIPKAGQTSPQFGSIVRLRGPLSSAKPNCPTPNATASSSKLPPRGPYPTSHANVVAPLQMIQVRRKALPQSLKRPRIENDSDDDDDNGMSKEPTYSLQPQGKWATVEGKKKYPDLKFKKNKI
jgi:hypothetical protein